MNQGTISDILRRYGRSVTLCRPDGTCVEGHAFVQPIRSEDAFQPLPTPLGGRSEDRFLYLGSGACAVAAGEDTISCGGMCYEVLQAQPIYIGEAISHWWAVLTPGEETV